MTTRQAKSFCRLCMTHCGMVLTLDSDERLVDIRGDHHDVSSLGYACFKGLQAAETHYSPHRILHPLKQQPDGSFARIPLEQALDEVAAITARILERDGPQAVAGYRGSQGIITSSASLMLPAWLRALGSHKFFTSATIDQSAKLVSLGRIGLWPAGHVPFAKSDVAMLVGNNPLVSLTSGSVDFRNPSKRLREAKARGLKLIVIDPRLTETAKQSDVFLQPLPGEDVTIAAGLLRIILTEGWEDKAFCAAHVSQLDELRTAVEPFTPEYVERRAELPRAKLREAAEVFAKHSQRGAVSTGTGPDMGPHSNLAEHLYECMNVVCGRFLREGEEVPNPGVLNRRWPRKAQVIPAPRWWETGFKSRIGGYGIIDGEMMTGILADEILQPGDGQIRAIFNDGGGIANAVPDQEKIVAALGSLELLVSIEPFMTPTAQLSHYIFPPKMQYERSDFPMFVYESYIFPEPFTRYTPPILPLPAGSEIVDDAYVFWSVAKRLGVVIEYDGVTLDMQNAPTNDELLAIIAKRSPVAPTSLSELEPGVMFSQVPQHIEPADPGNTARFTVMPPDVAQELRAVAAESIQRCATFKDGSVASYRMVVRRNRDMYNSTGRFVSTIRERIPHNPAFLNPLDMADLCLAEGDAVQIASDHGCIVACASADPTLRRGIVSISHGFGGLPGKKTIAASPQSKSSSGYDAVNGVSTNLLLTTDEDLQTINAMPRMSAIPVNLTRVAASKAS